MLVSHYPERMSLASMQGNIMNSTIFEPAFWISPQANPKMIQELNTSFGSISFRQGFTSLDVCFFSAAKLFLQLLKARLVKVIEQVVALETVK